MCDLHGDITWHDYAEGCKVLHSESLGRGWVLGARWLPTMGTRSRKLLLKQLYREQVRWCVGTQSHSGTIGFLPRDGEKNVAFSESQLCCAALMFALAHSQGTHVLRVICSPSLYWFVVAHEGHVLSQSDCLLPSSLAVDLLQTELCRRFARVTVHEVDAVSMTSLLEAMPFLGQATLQAPTQFQRLTQRRPWWRMAAGVMLVLIAGLWRYGTFVSKSPVVPPPLPSTPEPPAVIISHEDLLVTLQQRWENVPVQLGGWQLDGVQCTLQESNGQCRLIYRRQNLQASNQSLHAISSLGWSMVPVSLDRTEWVCTFSVPVVREAIQSLSRYASSTAIDPTLNVEPPSKFGASPRWLEDLQRLSTVAHAVVLGERRPQATLPELWQRSLRVQMSLRDLSQLAALRLPVRWHSVRVDVYPSRPEGLRDRLWVQVEGTVYENS